MHRNLPCSGKAVTKERLLVGKEKVENKVPRSRGNVVSQTTKLQTEGIWKTTMRFSVK